MKVFNVCDLVDLDLEKPLWEQFFTVAPLVVIGSREPDGSFDLAPKHLALPMGWSPFFGFVCTPNHQTCRNVQRERCFTVSYPRPDSVLLAALAASPRCSDKRKPVLESLPTFSARRVEGVLLEDGYLFLECVHHKIVDGFGSNSLITGKVVAARVHSSAQRASDRDDGDLLGQHPLLAYLYPNRFARLDKSLSFPFPRGFKR